MSGRRTMGRAWPAGTDRWMLRLAYLCIYGEDADFMDALTAIPRPPDILDPDRTELLAARETAIGDLIAAWHLDRVAPEGPTAVREWLDERDWYGLTPTLFPPGAGRVVASPEERVTAGAGTWDVRVETRTQARGRIRRETRQVPTTAELDAAVAAAEEAGWEWLDTPNDPEAVRRLLGLLYRHVARGEKYRDIARHEARTGLDVEADYLRVSAWRLGRRAGIDQSA